MKEVLSTEQQFPEDLYVIAATHDDGLTAIDYYAASTENPCR